MENSPLISIIIPAYNAEAYLAKTLDSVLNQRFTDWECVIVNDGSKDETLAVAQHYASKDPRIRAFDKPNGGMSHTRNYGYARTDPNSKYISHMDSDDLWTPEALQLLFAELEAHPTAVGAHGIADMIDSKGDPYLPGGYAQFARERTVCRNKRIVPLNITEPTIFASVFLFPRIVPPGVLLVRRSIHEQVGGWDPSFLVAADWDFVLRVSRFGDIRFINEIIVLYRRHPGNLSKSRSAAETRRMFHKSFFAPENNEEQTRIVREGWRAFQLSKMQEKFRRALGDLTKCKLKSGFILLAHIPAHGVRYLRGYPKERGL